MPWCSNPIDPDGHALPADELAGPSAAVTSLTDDEFDEDRLDEDALAVGDDADEYDDDDDGDDADADEGESHSVELRVDEVDDPIRHLLRGEISVEGRMPYSCNATFLVHVEHDGSSHPAIYKPMRGERPLWDFEPGLHRREVAAYLLSEALGFGVIPPTVLRDGPLGEGSFQWFVDADHRQHYFTIHEQYPELHDRLREIAVLDIIANNTDRKSGHCLLVPAATASPRRCGGSTTACASPRSTSCAR